MSIKNLDNLCAIEIVGLMGEIRDTPNHDGDYEILFKALAKKVQGTGSLLWNENPIDLITDGDFPNEFLAELVKMHELQKQWLIEIGMSDIACRW